MTTARRPKVELIVRGFPNGHTSMVFAGLASLASAKAITLRQRFADPLPASRYEQPWLSNVRSTYLEATIDGTPVVYDGHDTAFIDDLTGLRDRPAIWFKRSIDCRPGHPPVTFLDPTDADDPPTIVPFGLVLPAYREAPSSRALRRLLALHGGRNDLVNALGLGFRTRRPYMPIPPALLEKVSRHTSSDEPHVFAVTRLWDADAYDAPEDVRADIAEMNELRIGTTRAIREALPTTAHTGIMDSGYARSIAPDLVLDPALTGPAAYLATLAVNEICVTSRGLHQSNGFRLAEYVAAGRAIVTERPQHLIPGGFAEGVNYLGYDSVEECLAQIERLRDDHALRRAMMAANRDYYRVCANPTATVWRSVLAATSTPPRAG